MASGGDEVNKVRAKLAYLLAPPPRVSTATPAPSPPPAACVEAVSSEPAALVAELAQVAEQEEADASTDCPSTPEREAFTPGPESGKRPPQDTAEEAPRLRRRLRELGEQLQDADELNQRLWAYARELRTLLVAERGNESGLPEPPALEGPRLELVQKRPAVLGIRSSRCGGCGKEDGDSHRVMAEAGKVYCSTCWTAWERCGWWKPSIRILTAPPPVRTPGGMPQYVAEDAFVLPAFCCAHDDLSWFQKLKDELPEGSTFGDWHGGRHLGVQFQGDAQGARHDGANSPPHLRAMVAKLEQAFGIRAAASRINLYRSGDDYKPFHCDRGRDDEGVPQITVGVAFGGTRELTMMHIKSGVTATFPMKNGDVFSFTPELNTTFMHGVPKIGYGSPSDVEGRGERLSLILWGPKVTQ